MDERKALGAQGEEQAAKLLKKNGYKIIEKNYRSSFGEVDIIAEDKNDLVFIEVKLRTSDLFGLPQDAVNKKKQDKIIKSALQYVKSKGLIEKNLRFDVVVIGPEKGEMDIVRSAFLSDGFYKY
jgi:putative endonuclease